MSEVRTKIPVDVSKHYSRPWQSTQEELDAYDDLQRRKVNYQQPEYVENNELICFGLSSHEVEEAQNVYTTKAIHDLEVLRSWYRRDRR
mmetsp:Transcript_36064/g.26796  ORF Transcript_36064/g.26796 Transcript_36064/m.26796 type:complete len:89 (+) Transcript_36064:15-281(+)